MPAFQRAFPARVGQSLTVLARAVATVGLAAALALSPTAAQAHDLLEATNPTSGSAVQSVPASVVLTFDHTPIAIGTQILVNDHTGTNQADGPASVVDNTVTQAIKPGAPAGTYTVVWRVVSSDSHPIEGTFTFTAKAAVDTSPATASPGNGVAEGGEPVRPSNTSPSPSPGLPAWLTVAAIAAIIAIAALAFFVRRALARTAGPDPNPPDRLFRAVRMESESLLARRRSATAALIVGPTALGLGLVAHLVSGGAPPPFSVLVALTAFASLLAAAAARAQLPPWAIAVGSGALQQPLHLLFTALAGPNAPLFPSAGHVHNHSAVVPTQDPGGSLLPPDIRLLVVAQVAAALLTTLLATMANRVPTRWIPPARVRPQPRSRWHRRGIESGHECRVRVRHAAPGAGECG